MLSLLPLSGQAMLGYLAVYSFFLAFPVGVLLNSLTIETPRTFHLLSNLPKNVSI